MDCFFLEGRKVFFLPSTLCVVLNFTPFKTNGANTFHLHSSDAHTQFSTLLKGVRFAGMYA
jgi:hypothetical protein